MRTLLLPVALLVFSGCSESNFTATPPPDAPTVQIVPAEPTTTDVLQAELTAESPSPGVRYTYRWLQQGTGVSDLQGDAVPQARTTKGELWQVVVTPWSGSVAGAEARAEVTVRNSPPVIEASLNTVSPGSHQDLQVLVTATDADDDEVALRYGWEVDGRATEHDGPTLPATATVRGEAWRVTITPNDGEIDGESVTLSATVVNAPPTLDRATLSPDPAYASSTVSAQIEGLTDLDGDDITLTYDWTVDGAAVQSGEWSTLEPGLFAKHQEITVQVTPFDGFETGPAVLSDALLVRNSPPTAPGLTITPEEPDEEDDLVCELDLPSTDADDDALTYFVSWEVDGAAYTGAVETTAIDGDTVLFENTLVDDAWTCTAVAFDGDEDGPVGVSDEVIIAPATTCGDSVLDELEEVDPPPGPFSTVSVDDETCRWDFSEVEQLYCNGTCTWAGGSSCDEADADVFCQLKMDNPDSEATDYRIVRALDKPGFTCANGGYGTRINTDRGYSGPVAYQDESVLANHGAGWVIVEVECTDP